MQQQQQQQQTQALLSVFFCMLRVANIDLSIAISSELGNVLFGDASK